MTDRPQSPKSHHHTPEFYLKYFASPSTGQVWNYDKVNGCVWPASPDETGCANHLYSVTAEDGTRITDIEDTMSKIETAAAPLFNTLIEGGNFSDSQRYDVANFFALAFVRTNSFRRMYAELYGEFRMLRDYLVASDDTAFEHQMERFQEARGKISEEAKQKLRARMIDPSDSVIQVSREYTLQALACHDRLVPLFYTMNWSILYAPDDSFLLQVIIHFFSGCRLSTTIPFTEAEALEVDMPRQ